jgi:glyoxylase-like metal-dependent hydrolase (beta-lactamase superfamily II)
MLLTTLSLLVSVLQVSAAHFPQPSSGLEWDVYLQSPVPVANTTNLSFSPTAFTLIQGPTSAVLVDTTFTYTTTATLIRWLSKKLAGRKLAYLYITHGHGDHFFGIPLIQEAFPGVKVVATPETIVHMYQQIAEPFYSRFWEQGFPGQIPPQDFSTIQPLGHEDTFTIDHHVFRAVQVGQTDTYNTTVLHVPDLDLVVAGDAVYGECFQYFVDTNTVALQNQWLHAIDNIEALHPKIVVPSHKQAWDGFGLDHLHQTKEYIRTWEREASVAKSSADLEKRVTRAFPLRVGDFILQLSSDSVFASV